jgi:hypothetical protein
MDIEGAEAELVVILQDGYRRWAKGASILLSISDAHLLETNFVNRRYWFRAVARRAGSSATKLWRWLRAGQFYEKMRADYPGYPALTEVPFGLSTLELLSQLHRLMSGREFDELAASTKDRSVTQRTLRQILKMHQGSSGTPHQTPAFAQNRTIPPADDRASETRMIQSLVQELPRLQILPERGKLIVGEFFAVPGMATERRLQGALLAFDEAGIPTLHLFCPEASLRQNAPEKAIQLAAKLTKRCHFIWIVTPNRPSRSRIAALDRSGLGIIAALDGKAQICNDARRQEATDWLENLLELTRRRLDGTPVWRISQA